MTIGNIHSTIIIWLWNKFSFCSAFLVLTKKKFICWTFGNCSVITHIFLSAYYTQHCKSLQRIRGGLENMLAARNLAPAWFIIKLLWREIPLYSHLPSKAISKANSRRSFSSRRDFCKYAWSTNLKKNCGILVTGELVVSWSYYIFTHKHKKF